MQASGSWWGRGTRRALRLCGHGRAWLSSLPSPPRTPVIYNGCPRAFEAGIWWPQTKFGQPAAVPCPKGSVGKYRGLWHPFQAGSRSRRGGDLAEASELTGCPVSTKVFTGVLGEN